MRRAGLRLAPALLLGAALAACSKPAEVVPSDGSGAGTVDARVSDLERRLKEMGQDHTGAGLAAGAKQNEMEMLQRSVQELQNRLRSLETWQKQAAAMTAAAAAGGGDSSSPVLPPVPAGPMTGIEPVSPEGGFSDTQVSNFRKLQEEVERRRNAEAQAERVRRELTRAGVTLAPEQEAAVVRLQQTYAEKMRDLFRNGIGNTEADRRALQDQRDQLRTQFETEVRAVVVSADQERVIEALRRGLPGFFPRRGDIPRGAGSMGD